MRSKGIAELLAENERPAAGPGAPSFAQQLGLGQLLGGVVAQQQSGFNNPFAQQQLQQASGVQDIFTRLGFGRTPVEAKPHLRPLKRLHPLKSRRFCGPT